MKVAALLSGGVDSSVALYELSQSDNYKIEAFYLKIWLEDELAFLGNCPWEEDLKYARAVCEHLNIPLNVVPLQTEYHNRVVSYTLDELKAGRTPSPDIMCNQRIKFGAFLDQLDSSYDFICSGHYATVENHNGLYRLKRGVDPIKDQSYFLSHLSQQQLSRCIFPLGIYPKSDVRLKAKEYNLPTQDRPDSQGICFLGKIKYPDFVKYHLGEKQGDILDKKTNKKLGHHKGYWYHTIGQRKGLGLSGGPWFVAGKDTENNIIYVSHEDDYQSQFRDKFLISKINWIEKSPPSNERKMHCKLRHGPNTLTCSLEPAGEDMIVTIDPADSGIAPGQFCVLYDDETYCLGSGIINKLLP